MHEATRAFEDLLSSASLGTSLHWQLTGTRSPSIFCCQLILGLPLLLHHVRVQYNTGLAGWEEWSLVAWPSQLKDCLQIGEVSACCPDCCLTHSLGMKSLHHMSSILCRHLESIALSFFSWCAFLNAMVCTHVEFEYQGKFLVGAYFPQLIEGC